MVLQYLYKAITRLLFPDLIKGMEEEGVFELDLLNPAGSLEEADFMRVEDNGADVTIFAFSGPDVLYAGHSKFQLMGVIKRLGRKFGGANFVFLRDCQRLGFMLRPDGKRGGYDFYSEVVKATMKKLGASHNVAIGSSLGGMAAHYFAYSCGLQQVVTFSAVFTADSYLKIGNVFKTVFNFRQLIREPRGYFEILLVTGSTSLIYRMIGERIGVEYLPDIPGTYSGLSEKPAVTLFYGRFSPPDFAQAMLMRDFPEVKLVPVPTGKHNTPGFLYSGGKLGKAITDEISCALEQNAVNPA